MTTLKKYAQVNVFNTSLGGTLFFEGTAQIIKHNFENNYTVKFDGGDIVDRFIAEGEHTDDQFFAYLVTLRDSGETNMHGCVPYLTGTFGLSETDAGEVFDRWCRSLEDAA